MIKNGDIVTVHYECKLEDGTLVDSSYGKQPISFTIGEHRVIPGFEKALIGDNNVGDKIKADVAPEDGYGQIDPEYITTLPKSQFPDGIQVGQVLVADNNEGKPKMNITIKEINGDSVLIDANHPLAGKRLIFVIEITKIEQSQNI